MVPTKLFNLMAERTELVKAMELVKHYPKAYMALHRRWQLVDRLIQKVHKEEEEDAQSMGAKESAV